MTVTKTVVLDEHECIYCQGTYAISRQWYKKRSVDGQEFWCPYCGGSMVCRDSDVVVLKQQMAKVEKRLVAEIASHDQTKAALQSEQSAAAKMKKRVAAGVCPCCHRHFVKLERHMATKHPGFAGEST